MSSGKSVGRVKVTGIGEVKGHSRKRKGMDLLRCKKRRGCRPPPPIGYTWGNVQACMYTLHVGKSAC